MLIVISSEDNVAITTEHVLKGEVVSCNNKTYTLKQDIPKGHKVALIDLPKVLMLS